MGLNKVDFSIFLKNLLFMERLNTVIDWIGCLMLDVKKAELNIKKQEKLCLIDLDQE
jgi:hypothetical protein